MAIFVRRWSRNLKFCLLCLSVAVFGTVSLFVVTTIQEFNQRILSARAGGQDGLNCPSLDDVGVQLVRILGQWEAQATAGRREENADDDDYGLPLSLAVRALIENGRMAEERNVRRLFYLADVLRTFKERRSEVTRDENVTAKIADLVKIFAEVTSNRTKEGKNDHHHHHHHNPRPKKSRFYNENDTMTWQLVHNEIDQYELYSKDSLLVDRLLTDMATIPIEDIAELDDDGTQLKLVFYLEDGSRILFKPRRLPRDYEEPLDLYYMHEFEKHTAEIAAFHLDRILEFRRVPPAAGRYVDMLTDIYDHADEDLRDTFYRSPVMNQCFFGICHYFCDAGHGICGNDTTLEGSVVAYLPSRRVAKRTHLPNPWSRSYSKYEDADWETAEDGAEFCESVREEEPWKDHRALLNLIDAHIFDFLTGNKDRHHFEVFELFGNSSFPVLFDNGKGFGRANTDVVSILAPLYQCCMIRHSTLKRLLDLETGEVKLSELMRRSLAKDVLPDVLTEAHLKSLDRRLGIILEHVHDCIVDLGPQDVIVDR